jgi:hypothetical protein
VVRPDFRPATRFERRGERLGHGVWDLAYRKRNRRRNADALTVAAHEVSETAANSVDDELHGEGRENHAG